MLLMPTLFLTLAGPACWTTPDNDAGDEAFVVHAIETVLGRSARGSAEVRALVDLAARSGREAVVDVLFAEPEYVTYWSNVLADDLQVQRAGPMQVDADCLGPPLLDESLSDALAGHVATADPFDAFCTSSGAKFEVAGDQQAFWDAIDSASASYEYKASEQESQAPWKSLLRDEARQTSKETMSESKESNLEAGEAADYAQADDGKSAVTGVVDLGRWAELRDALTQRECPPFNLTDVLQAAVRADRLDGLYRAYLPVLASFPGTSVEDDLRNQLGATFLDVYVDRDPDCMRCHTATYSKTDARPVNGNWDRFDPMWVGLPFPVDMEGSVFSADVGADFVYGGDGGPSVRDRVANLFRSSNHASKGGLRPWGLEDTCVTNAARGYDGLEWYPPYDPLGREAAFAGLGPGAWPAVLDLATALSDGTQTLNQAQFSVPDWASHRAMRGASSSPSNPGCGTCHDPSSGDPSVANRPLAPLLDAKVETMTDDRLFSIVRFGFGEMPPVATSDQAAWDAVSWVRQNHRSMPAVQAQDRTHAFVYLLAANVVNQVVDEIAGEDLVMGHGFPRNPDQADVLSSLTGTLVTRFSLQDLLTEIVLSGAFNRAAPQDPNTVPDALPMVTFPEAEVRVPTGRLGENANSEADLVHRASVSALLMQLHGALGWPAPPVMGHDTAYPTQAWMASLGRHESHTRTEATQVGFFDFLAWEGGTGLCDKPGSVFAKDVLPASGTSPGPTQVLAPTEWVDWIDALAADGEARGLSWYDLALSLRDRLLADPNLDPTEAQLVANLWNVYDMNDSPVDDDGRISSGEADQLRDYCGALLSSPHTLLRGLWLGDAWSTATFFPVGGVLTDPTCLPGEDCTQSALFDHYSSQASKLGYGGSKEDGGKE